MGGDPEHSGGQVPDSGNAGDKSSQAPDPNKKPGKALADHRSRGWRALLSGGPSRALDLIRAGFVVETADAGVTYCLVSGADDADRTTSIRGILEESTGVSFRLCRDDRSAPVDVGCDSPHTGEYIGSPAGAG